MLGMHNYDVVNTDLYLSSGSNNKEITSYAPGGISIHYKEMLAPAATQASINSSIRNVNAWFGNKHVVKDVSLDVKENSVTGFYRTFWMR